VSESRAAKSSVDIETVRRALEILVRQDSVAELRAPNIHGRGTVSGYFNDLGKMAENAGGLSGKAGGVYATLNPVRPELLARASNRLVDFARHTTGDTDIVRLTWFLIDFDPVRPAGISATDAEHEAALERAGQCRKWLRAEGWPESVFSDSGNGGHLAYRVDLANTSENTQMLRSALLALGLLFSDSTVQVDPSTYNAARIVKVCGTLAAKGDSLPSRPHRLSRLVDVPPEPQTVSVGLLVGLAARIPRAEPQAQAGQSRSKGNGFDLDRWIVDHRLPVDGPTTWNGGRRWVFEVCPFNPEHRNRSAYIVQFPSGAIAAGCFHKSCEGEHWPALRDLVEADWRIHPAQRKDLGSRQVTASDWTKPESPEVDGGGSAEAPAEPPNENPSIPAFPEAAWRGIFAEYRTATLGKSEAAEAFHFASLWAVCAAALERRVWFPYGMDLYPNVYLVCFGPSADKKTSAERLAVRQAEYAGLRVIRGSGSGEGIADELQQGPALIFAEELSAIQRGASWQGATLAVVLSECFDCPPRFHRAFRKTNRIQIEEPTLNLLSATTGDWFWRDTRDADLSGGLGSRLFYLDGTPRPDVPLPGRIDVRFVGDLLAHLQKIPATEVGLDAQAVQLWNTFYGLSARRGLDPLESAMTKRIRSYALKLGMSYSAIEDTLPVMKAEQLAAAITVAEYGAGSVKRLIDSRHAGTNPTKDLEQRILRAVKNTRGQTTKRYLQQSLNRFTPSAEAFNKAFDALKRSEQIETRIEPSGRTWVWWGEGTGVPCITV
jgi:hypothetical protein